MDKIVIAVHGGLGLDKKFLKAHQNAMEAGLKEALLAGYSLLKKGSSSLSAVEAAVKILEDDPCFNAGKGSALNCKGEVEMDASIMDGKRLRAGAVSMVRNVRNPVVLAKTIMQKTKHVFISGYGALEFAKSSEIQLEPESYFVTEHQYENFMRFMKRATLQKILRKKIYGTVGAVALDRKGNLAAATSTGGTNHCLPGRIGDSCVIGAGCYANNHSCAVSGTGDGEILITHVVAHAIAMRIALQNLSVQQACEEVIFCKTRPLTGNAGVISIDRHGEIGVAFNTEFMKRAWITADGKMEIKIFKE